MFGCNFRNGQVLILANHVGDLDVLKEAIVLTKN
jgi:hypothetical protein